MPLKEFTETHMQGTISIENVPEELTKFKYMKGDIGLQVSKDGRIWICINGMAFLRFSPHPNGEMSKNGVDK